MPLTVVSVAYPLVPVGPDAVGGAEQVLAQLDAALCRAGHRSIVVAREGSRVEGELRAVPAVLGPLDDRARARAQVDHRRALADVLKREPVDLVHLHGIDFLEYLPPAGVPVLATLHLPPDWYPPEVFRLTRPETFLHCVSAEQQRSCPAGARLLPPIANGVAAPALRIRKRRFAVSLGRICPEKGFHLAAEAARRAGILWLLAGEVFRYSAHEAYFRDELAPRLDGLRRFIGPIGSVRKRRLLAAAQCVLIPSLAPETSSLVAMEALAQGTPVIAFPNGALREIVAHGRTGFLVADEREMAAAIDAAPAIDPEACRAAARTRFSLDRMTAEYLALYARIAARRGAPQCC
jgi:hypothetical protein